MLRGPLRRSPRQLPVRLGQPVRQSWLALRCAAITNSAAAPA